MLVNNVYWGITISCYIIILFSYYNKKAMDLIWPANILVNFRQVFRVLDFEKTKFD